MIHLCFSIVPLFDAEARKRCLRDSQAVLRHAVNQNICEKFKGVQMRARGEPRGPDEGKGGGQ